MINFNTNSKIIDREYLTLVYFIVLIMINWKTSNFISDNIYLFKIIFISMLLVMISMIDIYVPEEYGKIFEHTRSGLETMSIVLITYGMYIYFLSICHKKRDN